MYFHSRQAKRCARSVAPTGFAQFLRGACVPSAQGGRNGTRDGVTRRLGAQKLYAVRESVVRYAGRNEARRTLGQGENGYGKRCAYNGLLASFLEECAFLRHKAVGMGQGGRDALGRL